MIIYTMVFSPTGSTHRIAKTLAAAWGGEIREIDLSKEEEPTVCISEEDVCMVAVPSFGGRVPAIARKRLELWKGNGCDTILITTFGNRAYDDTLLELQDIMMPGDFHPIGAIAAVCQHSIMPQFGGGRPTQKDLQELCSFIEQIKEQRKQRIIGTLKLSGNHPYREYNGVPMKPHTTSSCTKCGICATSCPVQAIPLDHPEQTLKDLCISCMRCITICPNQARSMNHMVVLAASLKMKKACSEPKPNELFLLSEE